MKEFKGFVHGVNLGGWLSQCDYSKERMDNFIREEDFEIIASRGLDHVRLPFDYPVVQDENGNLLEDGFDRLERAIRLSRQNGLNIILDLHKTNGFCFDEEKNTFFESEECQKRFYAIWDEVAKRFGHDPEHVAFELLNEVTDQTYSVIWNRIARTCIERIRTFAPDVVILVGSYWNNQVSAVKDLDAPYDEKIVYNFHCYDPLNFTHQGAYWVKDMAPDYRATFESTGVSTEYFEDMFREAIGYAEKNGTVLYCGEYGVIELARPEDTLAWYKAIRQVFDRHGIGRAAWSYRGMDFDLINPRLTDVWKEM